jgi:hypothetical protein
VPADGSLVHLGNHPEVGICVNCVSFLVRKARGLQGSRVQRRLHAIAESVRGEVMNRGWHDRTVIGPVLLWLNRRLPW